MIFGTEHSRVVGHDCPVERMNGKQMFCNIRSERALHVAQGQDYSEQPKTKKKKIWEPCFSEIVCSRFSDFSKLNWPGEKL